ncbi:MAG: TetR/AcrR family transcriptional regulator [Christensenellaceae bacterium]|nr:TetR/AcrR family transcriptional regulator [Christensenellaceae bacterium]
MDKRIINTKASLKKGLFELLSIKPVAKITVKELCEQAHVNRSTFYAYYKSPEELLNEVVTELNASFIKAAEDGFEDKTSVKRMLGVAYDNRSIISVIMGNKAFGEFVRGIFNCLEERTVASWQQVYGADEQFARQAYVFAVGGAAGTVEAWIKEGFKASPEEIADRITTFARKGTEGLNKQ